MRKFCFSDQEKWSLNDLERVSKRIEKEIARRREAGIPDHVVPAQMQAQQTLARVANAPSAEPDLKKWEQSLQQEIEAYQRRRRRGVIRA